MRTRVPAPVCVPGSTCTPAARAVSRSPRFVDRRASAASSAASTCAIALPTSTRRCSPVAVVTTGVSVAATARIWKSAVAVPPDGERHAELLLGEADAQHAEVDLAGAHAAQRELARAVGLGADVRADDVDLRGDDGLAGGVGDAAGDRALLRLRAGDAGERRDAQHRGGRGESSTTSHEDLGVAPGGEEILGETTDRSYGRADPWHPSAVTANAGRSRRDAPGAS